MTNSKLPWRTIIRSSGPAGRFTREQIRAAVLEVKAMREAQAAQTGQRSGKQPARAAK